MVTTHGSDDHTDQSGNGAIDGVSSGDKSSTPPAYRLTPLDARKRADQVRDSLLQLVRDGHFKHGDKLPTERQLSEMFEVGRSSIREAVRSLVGIGIIEMRRGRGAFVSKTSLSDLVMMFDGAVRLEYGSALQLHEVRTMIEVTGALLAATRRTAEDIASAQTAIDELAKFPDDAPIQVLVTSDLAFHRAVIHAAHNELLNQLLDSISGLLRQHHRQYAVYNEPSELQGAIRGHTAILEAITHGDSRLAASRMQTHMRSIWTRIEALAIHEDDGMLDGLSYLPMYDEVEE